MLYNVIVRSRIMKRYETPQMEPIYFNIDGKIMDGYSEGDTNENPWSDLFKDETSGEVNTQL